jgi:hypothetical protein
MPEANSKECKEYNSLKYRTMIMTGHNIEDKGGNETSEQQLDSFLLNESQVNKKQTWSKLSKTERLKKLNLFIETDLIALYGLNENETQKLKIFIHGLVERKRILKVNEITYNEESGKIECVHIVLFNENNRRFTLNHNINSQGSKKTQKKVKK